MTTPISSAVQPTPAASLTRTLAETSSRVVLFLAMVREALRDAREMERQAHTDFPYIGL